jgi:hypothetical protein
METRHFVVLVLVAACTSNEPTKQELCEQLEDRVVEQRVNAIHASAPDPFAAGSAFGTKPAAGLKPVGPDIEGHRVAMKQALGSAYVDSCVEKLSEQQLKCSLAAADGEAVANCQTATN